MHEKVEKKTVVLTRVGTDFWSRPVYKVGDYDAYVKDIELGRFNEPSLYWSCPRNDPDGEPDTPFKGRCRSHHQRIQTGSSFKRRQKTYPGQNDCGK